MLKIISLISWHLEETHGDVSRRPKTNLIVEDVSRRRKTKHKGIIPPVEHDLVEGYSAYQLPRGL